MANAVVEVLLMSAPSPVEADTVVETSLAEVVTAVTIMVRPDLAEGVIAILIGEMESKSI